MHSVGQECDNIGWYEGFFNERELLQEKARLEFIIWQLYWSVKSKINNSLEASKSDPFCKILKIQVVILVNSSSYEVFW